MNKNGKKEFDKWIEIKKKIHYDKIGHTFSEGEVWWCKIGENVGSEICGKGNDFLRPVLVVTKLSKNNFIGVPLTSKEHNGSWYVKFDFKGKRQFAAVAQIENMSVYRLHYKMGRVPNSDLDAVIDGIYGLIRKK